MSRNSKIIIGLTSILATIGLVYFLYRAKIKKKINNFFDDPDKYYVGRVLPKSYFAFWKNYMGASVTEQRIIRNKMESVIKASMSRAKKHYIDWYSNPMTIAKLPKEDASKLDELKNTFIPSIDYKINYDRHFTKNKDVQDAYAFVSSVNPNMININVYNFWTGDFQGEVGLYDTITHEMSHCIDYFLNQKGVTLYQKISTMENQVGSDSYIMNNQEQFARLSTFRSQFDIPPMASYQDIANIWNKSIKSGKVQSRDFNLSVSSDSKNLIFTPKSGKVVINAKTKIDRLNQIWQIFFFDVKLIVNGRTDANLNPLFTNFASINNGSIYVATQPLAQLNIETAKVDVKPTKQKPLLGMEIDNSQSLAFEGSKNSRIRCRNCNWSWKVKDGGDDLYVCHRCYTDNSNFYLKNRNL